MENERTEEQSLLKRSKENDKDKKQKKNGNNTEKNVSFFRKSTITNLVVEIILALAVNDSLIIGWFFRFASKLEYQK